MTIREAACDRIYDAVLARGQEGQDSYYAALRVAGFAATPEDEPGHLYSSNPVVVPRRIVDAMTEDINRFCDARRASIRDADDFLALVPESVRDSVGSSEIADCLLESLGRRHPHACLDAYLVERNGRLDRSYLEWQTQPTYPATALLVLDIQRSVFPEIEASGCAFTGVAGSNLEHSRDFLRQSLVHGFEDDPRQVVLLDFEPEMQATRREFFRTQDLTGGPERGLGIIDPRQVQYIEGRPHYERDGVMIPIGAVISRLVSNELTESLWPRLSPDERETARRFFKDTAMDWRSHPFHFHYGSKADFADFSAAELSDGLGECRMAEEADRARVHDGRLAGFVQKPLEGHGGRDIIVEPTAEEIQPGQLLQRIIDPAVCHRTLWGNHAPEVRVMGVPGPDGRLVTFAMFSRVKAPDEFRSNAGITADQGVPGTGEGYAVIAE